MNTSSIIKFFAVQNINRTYKMGTLKQINIKNRTYYFYNDIIDIENFDGKLLKIDKKSYKDIDIMNMSQRKKLVIVKILIVLILCI